MKRVILYIFFSFILQSAFSQIILKGIVFDSVSFNRLSDVSIENITTHQGILSNNKGEYSIQAKIGDIIQFTSIGYKSFFFKIRTTDSIQINEIRLSPLVIKLKTIQIKSGYTKYQQDSIERAKTYKKAFEYDQQKSVMSPVTSLYQKFSKKYKDLRRFQENIQETEKQKFIDTRYTPELVHNLTQLQEEELATFIYKYPMDYEYARTASDLEIKMWIKNNFADYKKKK